MKPGAGWPIGVAVILGVTVIANLVVMRLATNDPSFAIEPDYYKKAVAFDSTIAEERRSVALGWTATSRILVGDSVGRPTLTVTLLDAQRQPVQGATMKAVALANIRSNDLVSVSLNEVAPGQYAARLGARISGQWEVRIDAVRGADHFATSTRTDIP